MQKNQLITATRKTTGELVDLCDSFAQDVKRVPRVPRRAKSQRSPETTPAISSDESDDNNDLRLGQLVYIKTDVAPQKHPFDPPFQVLLVGDNRTQVKKNLKQESL